MNLDLDLLGRVIAKLCTLRGWSQVDFGKRVGLSTIPQVETGQKGLSLQALNRIASELGISFGGLAYLATTCKAGEDRELIDAQARLALQVFARKNDVLNDAVHREFPRISKNTTASTSTILERI